MTLRKFIFASATLALATSAACSSSSSTTGDDADDAEVAIDSTTTGQSEGALYATAFDGALAVQAAAPLTPETIASAIGDRVAAALTPAACATSTTSGATVTITLASCGGTRGLVDVSGTLAFTIQSVTASSIAFSATASGLDADGGTLDISATGAYAMTGGTQSIAVTSSTTASGPLGKSVSHEGMYDVTWDGTCATVDGAWAGSAGEHTRGLDVHVERCVEKCPSGSATRTLTGSAGSATLTIGFDGTANATWSSTRGKSGSVPLACMP